MPLAATGVGDGDCVGAGEIVEAGAIDEAGGVVVAGTRPDGTMKSTAPVLLITVMYPPLALETVRLQGVVPAK